MHEMEKKNQQQESFFNYALVIQKWHQNYLTNIPNLTAAKPEKKILMQRNIMNTFETMHKSFLSKIYDLKKHEIENTSNDNKEQVRKKIQDLEVLHAQTRNKIIEKLVPNKLLMQR